ncbi:MAG: glutamate formimidoyltransferase [Candidatus Margulisiibacteriota bacterium]
MEKIIECVPNFSIGKNPANAESIISAVRSAGPSVIIADHSYDLDHGRLVITLFGEGEALKESVYQGIKKAAEKIDITKHQGQHPCMGVADVVPFIPVKRATFNDCIKLRNDLSEKIASQLHIPVYIYGNIAKRPERKELSFVRRGGLNGVGKRICTVEGKPDFGPSRLHPTAGAVAVGARDILIAFNINLKKASLEDAKAIATLVREKDGGLKGVRAIGLDLESRHLAQVSVNIVNYKASSIKKVFDGVRTEAEKRNIQVEESEIIGLIPKDAVFEGMISYLKLKGWDGGRIIENFV